MARKRQDGQVLLLLVVALGLFLLGAVGLAIDASVLYSHRQLAQAAADAAAEAAIMSVFNDTNTAAYSNVFGSTAFTCTTGNDTRTPCVYARYHGFGTTANETVTVDFPTSVPGVTLSGEDDPAAIGVTVSRTVDTGLIRFVGQSLATVRARAVAVITDVFSPVPIIILHPTAGVGTFPGPPSGALHRNGTPIVQICGGPTKSIQVNSNHAQSISTSGGANIIDLSKAGPKNWAGPNSCVGEGADFGNSGGQTTFPGQLWLGSDGRYVQPSSPIEDPLRNVPYPAVPGPPILAPQTVVGGTPGCPRPVGQNCTRYYPGLYPTGIRTAVQELAIFRPGVYYLRGNFDIRANSAAMMDSSAPCGLLNFNCGMMVFIEGNGSILFSANSGKIQGVSYQYIFPNGTVCQGNCLLGSDTAGIYKGILFFKQRETAFTTHTLWGGADLTLQGTIYLTNTKETMLANEANRQWLDLGGNGGGTTRVIGMIIVDQLTLSGSSTIRMTLDPNASLNIRQVALAR